MTAEIPTPKEKQQEHIKKHQENRMKPQEHHQMMTKSLEIYKEETMDAEKHIVALTQHKSVSAVVAPVMIRERSTMFDESQVKTPLKEWKPTTKKKQIKNQKKQGMQEKYKKDKERTSKLPCTKVHHNSLTHDAWKKKRRHKYHSANPFQFNPWYKN